MTQPAQQAQQNQPTPQQVFEEGHRLLRMGDVFEASKRAGMLRQHFPDDIPILALHGFVLAQMGVHPQALSDLIKAAQLTEQGLKDDKEENQARPRIVDQLIRLCVQICRSSIEIGEFKAASEAIEQALTWDPDRGDAIAAKAELLARQGKPDDGLKLIAQGEKDMLDSKPMVLSKAKILLSINDTDASAFETVLNELDTESQVSGIGALELGEILRTIGAVSDRLKNHEQAFGAFRRAAKLRRGSYDARNHTMMTTKIIGEWKLDTIAKLAKPEQSGERYVLLLGAPGSGTSELGELLAQLEDVTVLGPLETMSSIGVRNLNARQGVLRPVPFEPSKLRGDQLKEASATYVSQTTYMMPEQISRGIDTHPLNIPLAGAASAFLPGLNIVMCRRDPMESTLACYCGAMIGNHPYAGDLIDAAGFVGDCHRMLDHWSSILGDDSIGANMVEVNYSDLAKDPKKVAAKVAREIGLNARATAFKLVPSFDSGPGAHPQDYASFTKVIEGFFAPLEA